MAYLVITIKVSYYFKGKENILVEDETRLPLPIQKPIPFPPELPFPFPPKLPSIPFSLKFDDLPPPPLPLKLDDLPPIPPIPSYKLKLTGIPFPPKQSFPFPPKLSPIPFPFELDDIPPLPLPLNLKGIPPLPPLPNYRLKLDSLPFPPPLPFPFPPKLTGLPPFDLDFGLPMDFFPFSLPTVVISTRIE